MSALQNLNQAIELLVQARDSMLASSTPRSGGFDTLFQNGVRDTTESAQGGRIQVAAHVSLCEGFSIGFQNDAEVYLSSAPKESILQSPAKYHYTIELSCADIKDSNYLTLEAEYDLAYLVENDFIYFSMAGCGTWGLRGEVTIRLFHKQSSELNQDLKLFHFELNDTRSVFNAEKTIELDALNLDDYKDKFKTIVFLEPRNFTANIDYIQINFIKSAS